MFRFPLSVESGIIVLDVRFTGKNRRMISVRMALDTGANMTTIPFEMGILLGSKPDKSMTRAEMLTASGIEYAPVVSIPRVKLFNFELKDVDVVCHTLPPRSVAVGLLGLDILSRFNIHLDFLKDFLEVSDQ